MLLDANRSCVSTRAEGCHVPDSCFTRALSLQNAKLPQISERRIGSHIQVCEWRIWLMHILLEKNFPIVFLSSKVLNGPICILMFQTFQPPLKHFDCFSHWVGLHNAVFQMISFSLAAYNSRINSLLHTPCLSVYSFYFYSASSFVFLLPFRPTCFEFA